jgi:5-methylcytosine-specific restriction endonuclease McrA
MVSGELVSSRAEARELGLAFYFGKPCKHGHSGKRHTRSAVCVECNKLAIAAWDRRNATQRKRRYRSTERGREVTNAASRKWRSKNKARVNWHCNNRRAALLQATPSWADKEEIYRFYAECPDGFEVDHRVPLKGENVCGLHVPWNLQYLTRQQNSSKGNRLIEDGQAPFSNPSVPSDPHVS